MNNNINDVVEGGSLTPYRNLRQSEIDSLSRGDINCDWNVVTDQDFKKRIRKVFEMVSNSLQNTLGPYGSTTIIETFGDVHITKDGWQVLKKIHFGDRINQTIMQLLFNISAQVVIKVGDGSTSSIMAANTVLDHLEGNEKLSKMRSKEFLDTLNRVVGKVSNAILEQAIQIDRNSDYSEINKLAMISTNGDALVAGMIQEIYQKTGNPSIEFRKGKGAETTFEIIDGYKNNITYLDGVYSMNEDGECIVKRPYILMVDHRIDKDVHLPTLIKVATTKAYNEKRRLIVIAPHYDKFLLQQLSTMVNQEIRATGTTTVVYCRVPLLNNMSAELFNDFAVLTGGQIVRETHLDAIEEAGDDINVDEFLGQVDEMVISPTSTLIKGFSNRNDKMYEVVCNDAMSKYKAVELRHTEFGLVNTELYDLKQRISKLRGSMGVISVGGYSSIEKTANYDLVEDAVKACESAFSYGYNMGGNLIIPKVITDLKGQNEFEEEMLILLSEAFCDVYKKVLWNKYHSYDGLQEIIDKSISGGACYDLIAETYEGNVINSCFTDIEILKATTSIVSLLISSNQYIAVEVQE